MTRIGLISDTHGYLDPAVLNHFENCDEIWHAGDFGNAVIARQLSALAPLKGVFGNVDGYDIRGEFPLKLSWTSEGVKVFLTHIGGYPNRYAPGIREELKKEKASLFICGHSHILKIIFDKDLNCLHINPGAAGIQGLHKVRTIVRFSIDNDQIKNCEIIELGKRG